jgi:hypothetical protein
MDINNTLRATYSHPNLSRCGTMTGRLEHDPMEGKVVFIPDEAHAKDVLSYGYEPEGGLGLEGAVVYTASH